MDLLHKPLAVVDDLFLRKGCGSPPQEQDWGLIERTKELLGSGVQVPVLALICS